MPLFLSRFSSESLESEDPTTSGATGKKRKKGEAQAEPDVPVADGEEGATRVGPMSLVVEPTRELARQVYKESLSLAAGTSFRVCLLGEGQDDDGGGDDVRPNDCGEQLPCPLREPYGNGSLTPTQKKPADRPLDLHASEASLRSKVETGRPDKVSGPSFTS